MDNEIESYLANNELFNGVSKEDIAELALLVKERVCQKLEYVIHEGGTDYNEFYLITSGQAEILKSHEDNENTSNLQIATLFEGETIGEIALLGEIPRTASVRAITDLKVLVIPIKELKELFSRRKADDILETETAHAKDAPIKQSMSELISLNLAKQLSKRLFISNSVTAKTLKNELNLEQLKNTMGQFLLVLISSIVIYAYFMSLTSLVSTKLPSATLILIPLMLSYASALLFFMKTSGYSAAFFGLTLRNWKKSALESILFSIPILLAILIAKWVLVHYFNFSEHIFDWTSRAVQAHSSEPFIFSIVVIYVLLSPLQELIVRGAIQGSLEFFLEGKNKVFTAIIISNLVFGVTHLHYSFLLAIIVVFFGIFWGWLYARQRNLIGPSISHILIGVWGLFIIGF